MNFESVKSWTDAGMPFNSFVCGDCMEAMRAMPDNFADLCICDPPYGKINERQTIPNKRIKTTNNISIGKLQYNEKGIK